ncbi:MAG: DNA-binding transcriptional regulator Fis [Gammaproteobacteria bacterium]|jgi:Fis family transcriptional regulator|nr:MAG: DNA-binding transcriptional regulator Fis [Gammaproteobacteria bacterium]
MIKADQHTETESGGYRQPRALSDQVRDAVERYFSDLDGHDSSELYELILSQVEKPLFESVLKNTRGNLSKAAQVLGMNRGTLRTRLKKYGLEP